MTWGELCGEWVALTAAAELELSGLTADSRQVRPGNLFIALPHDSRPGFKFDGHDYLADAVARGALAVLGSDPARLAASRVPWAVHHDPRWLLPRLAARWFGWPSRQLRLVGVTGTNGKTTTCYLTESILQQAGYLTVLAGTVETRLADERRPATTTTPDPVSLQELWHEAVGRGVAAGTMEVSSHALDQHRVDRTRYEVAAILNVTQDHLDYHETMPAYFAAKARLFDSDDDGWRPKAVLNLDDEWCRSLLDQGVHEPLTFGLESAADVRASEISFDLKGSACTVTTPRGTWHQPLRVVGRYNVANALAATAIALQLGLEPEVIRTALSACGGAPGRLEPVDVGQAFAVLVDYSHTDDALSNALRAARQLTHGKLLCVFGCGGDRDRTKRPKMGRVAVELSDRVVVTSDNPRTEDPGTIVEDILVGTREVTGAEVLVEVDRRKAIGRALASARPGDVVLIAGKGHEDYQILGERKVHFDDREVARDWLNAHG